MQDMMTTPTDISINNLTGEITVSSTLDYDQDGFVSPILTHIFATDSPNCENNGSYFEE